MNERLIDVNLVLDATMMTVKHLEECGLIREEAMPLTLEIVQAGIEAALIAHVTLVLRKLADSGQSVN